MKKHSEELIRKSVMLNKDDLEQLEKKIKKINLSEAIRDLISKEINKKVK